MVSARECICFIESPLKMMKNAFYLAYYKTRNSGTRSTGGTAEHPRNSGRTTEHYPEHQRNTPEYQRNTNVTPVEHAGTTERYNTKNNCIVFKRKFKPENLNFQVRVETFFIVDINFLIIFFSFLRLVYT